jgi:hypothetical protein
VPALRRCHRPVRGSSWTLRPLGDCSLQPTSNKKLAASSQPQTKRLQLALTSNEAGTG